jgi:hypothetical protein
VRRLAILAALLAILATAPGGCGTPRGQYNAVAVGMSQGRVKEILGTPRYQLADEWVYTQDDPRDLTLVTVRFKDGKLVAKSWQNPEKPEDDHRVGPPPNGSGAAAE